MNIKELEYRAAKARRKVLRMLARGPGGHMGGAMSCIDILTVLYFHAMNIDPKNPKLPQRDRFILSAGHKCMALYSVLCERGFFEEELLDTYGSLNTKLPGHPDMHKLPGVEANTGALGHGLSIAVGMALGLKDKGARVFVLLGDGELPEGSNWEGAAAAVHHGLGNLCIFIDANGLQISGKTKDVMNMEQITEKFASFGWNTMTADGNNIQELTDTLSTLDPSDSKPTAVVLYTVKGKGISFAENKVSYHYWKPSKEELSIAIKELDDEIERKRVAL